MSQQKSNLILDRIFFLFSNFAICSLHPLYNFTLISTNWSNHIAKYCQEQCSTKSKIMLHPFYNVHVAFKIWNFDNLCRKGLATLLFYTVTKLLLYFFRGQVKTINSKHDIFCCGFKKHKQSGAILGTYFVFLTSNKRGISRFERYVFASSVLIFPLRTRINDSFFRGILTV